MTLTIECALWLCLYKLCAWQ